MLKFIKAAVLLTAFASCNNEGDSSKTVTDSSTMKTDSTMHNSLSDAQKSEGWQLMFDGKSTAGWHSYGNKPVGTAWKVADGAVYLDTSSKQNGKVTGGGDLVSDDEYGNFHLKLEWKIAKAGNSGIIFYINEDTAKFKHTYESGPEMQVLDNEGHSDAKYPKHRAGDLYDLIAGSKETVKPAGEWNSAEIKSVDGKLDFYLNGENIVSTTMWDDAWTQMIAKSKFKQWPGFGTFKKGRIALQDHDNEVWYRNIMIRKL